MWKKNIHQSNSIRSDHKTNNAAPIAAATKPLPAILTAPPVLEVPAGVVEEAYVEGGVVTVALVVVLDDRISVGMVTPKPEQRTVAMVKISVRVLVRWEIKTKPN